jgi:BatD DUF11 like domain
MNRLNLYITWICLLISPALVNAQVLAKASLDRDSILIGEPLKLSLDVRAPLGLDINWFALDTIPHFEFIEKGKPDTSDNIDGKAIQQTITITSFDSGNWVIPPLPITINGRTYFTDSIPIKVTWSAFNPVEEYRDIKEITEVGQPTWMRYIPWIIAVATVLAAAGLWYFLRYRKQPVVVEEVYKSDLTPYDEALQALEELRSRGYAQNGQIKNYYSRLNDILRVFVLRKLKIATMEKTNEELILQLRQLQVDKETFSQLTTALRMADFVKFAKYQPDESDNEKNLTIIRTAITSLNNIQ